MDDETLRYLSSDAHGGRQRDVNTRWADVGQPVNRQRRLVGNHARDIRAADLWPEHRLHEVAVPRDRESREPVDAPRDPLDVSLLGELDQADLMEPGRAGLRGREVSGLILGDAVEHGVPLALVHDVCRVAII